MAKFELFYGFKISCKSKMIYEWRCMPKTWYIQRNGFQRQPTLLWQLGTLHRSGELRANRRVHELICPLPPAHLKPVTEGPLFRSDGDRREHLLPTSCMPHTLTEYVMLQPFTARIILTGWHRARCGTWRAVWHQPARPSVSPAPSHWPTFLISKDPCQTKAAARKEWVLPTRSEPPACPLLSVSSQPRGRPHPITPQPCISHSI